MTGIAPFSRADDRQAGMLLPEVLVGLAILSLATIAMLRVFSGATAVVGHVDALRARVAVAENLLSGLVAARRPPPPEMTGETQSLAFTIRSQPVPAVSGANTWMAYRVRISVGPDPTPILDSIVLGTAR